MTPEQFNSSVTPGDLVKVTLDDGSHFFGHTIGPAYLLGVTPVVRVNNHSNIQLLDSVERLPSEDSILLTLGKLFNGYTPGEAGWTNADQIILDRANQLFEGWKNSL